MKTTTHRPRAGALTVAELRSPGGHCLYRGCDLELAAELYAGDLDATLLVFPARTGTPPWL